MNFLHSRVICAALLSASTSAHGAFFCANSVATIASDLGTAASNGQDNIVRIVAGTYKFAAAATYSGDDATAIDISGGWNATCSIPAAAATILDGQNNVRALVVSQNSYDTGATINVHNLSLHGGLALDGQGGGGLYVFDGYAAVTIEGNKFEFNSSEQFGGGLYVLSRGPVTLRNNLFDFNSAGQNGGAAYIYTTDPNLYITGNTAVANSASTNTEAGGFMLEGLGSENSWISNNILWLNNTNGAYDLIASRPYVLLHNDIGTAYGTPDPLSTGNLSVDPQFAPCSGFLCFNFHLGRKSPLVNAGYDGPPGGRGNLDLDGADRLNGPHVDIGAYELDRIFFDDFE